MNNELPKYGIILLGLFMYYTAMDTTKILGGFFILGGLLMLVLLLKSGGK